MRRGMVVVGFQYLGELTPELGTIFPIEIIVDPFPIDIACKNRPLRNARFERIALGDDPAHGG